MKNVYGLDTVSAVKSNFGSVLQLSKQRPKNTSQSNRSSVVRAKSVLSGARNST